MRLALERNDEGKRALVLKRVEPLEGTLMSLWNSIIPNWWSANMPGGTWYPGTADLADRVWVANRCIQLNAQQIASMPIQFHGTDEPRWIRSPDPNWYPNGIGDALHSIVQLYYGWGFVCLYVTDRYADGFPASWTVLDSSQLNIKVVNGARQYKYGEQLLDAQRVVQIDRNPGVAVQGTPALRSYAQIAWGLLAAGNQSMTVSEGGIPQAVLKSSRKLTSVQASDIQTQWMEKTQARNGAPPVLPPEISFETLSFNPSDMSLLETQEFDARAIAAAFGVPSTMLNMPAAGGLTYNNPKLLAQQWWLFELRPTATRLADAFSEQMLPRGQYVSFDASDITADLGAQSAADDPQASQAPPPVQLTAVGGTR